jgi:hypothetical protein
MKFQVRQGFFATVATLVALGDGTDTVQEVRSGPGQVIDLTPEQAARHAHQIEPRDDEAAAWMKSRELVVSETPAIGLTPLQLQVLTQQIAQQLLAALPAATAAPPK